MKKFVIIMIAVSQTLCASMIGYIEYEGEHIRVGDSMALCERIIRMGDAEETTRYIGSRYFIDGRSMIARSWTTNKGELIVVYQKDKTGLKIHKMIFRTLPRVIWKGRVIQKPEEHEVKEFNFLPRSSWRYPLLEDEEIISLTSRFIRRDTDLWPETIES